LDLSFLGELPVDEARAWLTKFNGVGPKTAAIVLCFSLGKPAFPVDTHVYRVTGRIGLRPERMTVEQAHPHLEGLFPPETYYAAHLNLIRLGREICTARRPYCEKCPIVNLCDYGMNIMSLRAIEGSEARPAPPPDASASSQIRRSPRRRKNTGGSQ
jgi:endonuclease-3